MNARLAFALVSATAIAGCANQQEPSGGPIDYVAPEIVATVPASNQVNVRTDRIVIEFSEYVEQRSVEESIFISPSVGTTEFEWSGRSVEIILEDSLRPNTTYVLNIGTDVVDRRNRNRLAQSYILAFSTGPIIDRGTIAGQIIPRNSTDALSGVMVFAYRLEGRDPDTLDPRKTPPDYITQTGKDGSFLLRHVSFGSYQLLAVRDEFRNLLYDPETDDYGVPSTSFSISETDTMCSGLTMVLSREDTTEPRLIRVDALDRNHIGIQFSEAVRWESLNADSLDVRDTTTGKPLGVRDIMALVPGMTSFVLLTDDQDSTLTYRLIVKGVRDSVGLLTAPPTNALRFTGSGHEDTLRTQIRSVSITDSSRGIAATPTIKILFDDALPRTVPEWFAFLRDASGRPISLRIERTDAASFAVSPIQKLQSASWFTLKIFTDSLRDWNHQRLKDSNRVITFETVDEEEFGSIEGVVTGMVPSSRNADVFIICRSIDQKGAAVNMVKADSVGAFRISNVIGGKYLLRPFEDRNANGKYDPGLPFPRVLSEQIGIASDTLKVRPRWPLDGVVVRFR